jgi:hypothetical protein
MQVDVMFLAPELGRLKAANSPTPSRTNAATTAIPDRRDSSRRGHLTTLTNHYVVGRVSDFERGRRGRSGTSETSET